MINCEAVNKKLFGWLPVSFQEILGMMRRYSVFGKRGQGYALIAKIDGTTFHGGLCDRWKGIVSLYAFCKATHRDFRIYYIYPFDLKQFQLPNTYDWSIESEHVCTSIFGAKMLRLVGDSTLNRMRSLPVHKQIHAYANRDWLEVINQSYGTQFVWGELFTELFRPGEMVQSQLDTFASHTSEPYVAVAFRFQNLLGDYPEYGYAPARPDRQEVMLMLCCAYVKDLYNRLHLPILVTSDSVRMTESVKDLPYVFTNSHPASHVDTVADADAANYCKSFVDFYLLSGATAVYCPTTCEMYHSDFPRYAALLHNSAFYAVELE